MLYVGIDLGATFAKAAILDTAAKAVREVRRTPFPQFVSGLPSTCREVNSDAVVRVALELLEDVVRKAPDCVGLWVSSQMHGFVLCDGHGRARSPFFSWQDTRCLQRADEGSFFDLLQTRLEAKDIVELGNELRPGLPISTLFALRQAGNLGASLTPVALGDFVIASLAGVRPQTSWSQAAGLGTCRVKEACWHDEVLAKAGLDDLKWPRIHRTFEPWARVKVGGKILDCYPSVGDQQASLLGVGLRAHELSINIATGSQVSVLSSEPVSGNYQLRPFFDGSFLRTVTHLPAGRALNAIVRMLTELSDISEKSAWEAISAKVQSTGALGIEADLSFFPCATGKEGNFRHLTEENLRVGAVFAAAFGAMASNYKSAAQRVCPDSDWHNVVLSGGLACELGPLREMVLREVGGGYRLAPGKEDALMGLLALADATESGAAVAARCVHGQN
jgi:sugar (pentulose or hexulose) kinase